METLSILLGMVFWPTVLVLWVVVGRRLGFRRRVYRTGVVVLVVLPTLCALSLGHYMFLDEPLLSAAMEGDVSRVRCLLRLTANPNAEFESGFTPLREAAAAGHTEVVRLLLAHGARVDVENHWTGGTPLRAALANGHADIVKLLEKAGAKE